MRESTVADLLVNYGHFTTMQVRDGRVRGLDLHLARLQSANQELYGSDMPDVRPLVRSALGSTADASLRVTVTGAEPTIAVSVRPPRSADGAVKSLQSVRYLRAAAHIKHVGTFAQIHFGRVASAAGFDDALLVGPSGEVAETTIANIGFFGPSGVVWPEAPQLDGTTKQLLSAVVPSRRQVVRLEDLASFDGAFVTNSSGVAAVSRIDSHEFTGESPVLKSLAEVYESVPWDRI